MTSLLGLGGPKVLHIVHFKFRADAEPHVIQKSCHDFQDLAKSCLRDGKTYIHSIKAGKDMSIEGKSKGLTHTFVVTFHNVKDRDYYINEDPIHRGFAKAVVLAVEDAQVIDFVEGQF